MLISISCTNGIKRGAERAETASKQVVIEHEKEMKIVTNAAKFTPVLVREAERFSGNEGTAITVATSLVPGKKDTQKIAVASWMKQGFNVVSINSEEEIKELIPVFPEVSFAAARRNAGNTFGKPYIYFDDVLTYLSNEQGSNVCGIVNSDVILAGQELYDKISCEAIDALVFGSRVEIESLKALQGNMYDRGFDFFFFDKKLISLFPKEEFCLGVPWWDYWAVLIPLIHQENAEVKYHVKKVTNPVAFHIKHTVNWNEYSWLSMGYRLSKYLRPPYDLTEVTMYRYLQETLLIIHNLSQPIIL